MKLQGKKVLITGGAKRVGREITLTFARAGAEIFLHYHQSRPEAESLAQEIESLGAKRPFLFEANLLDSEERKRFTDDLLKKGGPDVFVHNASLFYRTPLNETTHKDWDNFLGLHVEAPFFLSQALAPAMKERGEGRIILISDWSALKPYKEYIPYCTSKGAMITLTQGLAKALSPEILVNAICPGPVLAGDHDSSDPRKTPEDKTLLKRWGSPKDVARLAQFLAESDFMTGHYHMVDGGAWLK